MGELWEWNYGNYLGVERSSALAPENKSQAAFLVEKRKSEKGLCYVCCSISSYFRNMIEVISI